MDTVVWAHFFGIEKRTATAPDFEDAVRAVWELGEEPGERELELSADDTRIRIERFTEQGDWIEGEVVRVQTSNIPPEAFPEGLQRSRAQSQGHSMVFRYHKRMHVLLAEKNRIGMTVSRFLRYLKRNDPLARYVAPPTADEDSWAKFGRKTISRFSVGISAIADPADIGGVAGAVSSASKRLHDMTHAPTVHISMYSGGAEDGLEKGAIRGAIETLLGGDPNYKVTALSVSGEDEDDRGSTAIDFLDDVLREREEIDLTELDADQSYNERIRFLHDCFATHIDYLERYYGMG